MHSEMVGGRPNGNKKNRKKLKAKIIDLKTWNEEEYGEPLGNIIGNYLSAGESLRSTAEILQIKTSVVLAICRKEGIQIPAGKRRPGLPATQETKARISAGTSRGLRRRRQGYNVHLLEFQGTTASLAEWSDTVNVERHTLNMRLRRGWSTERALTTPTQES